MRIAVKHITESKYASEMDYSTLSEYAPIMNKQTGFEVGLYLGFDGKQYTLATLDGLKKYAIGGAVCEYMRLSFMDIKPIIMSCDGLKCDGTKTNYDHVYRQFSNKITTEFPPIISELIKLEFHNMSSEWFRAVADNRIDDHVNKFKKMDCDIVEAIFENTGFTAPGGDTVLQIMLTFFLGFAANYMWEKDMFNQAVGNAADNEEDYTKWMETFRLSVGVYMDRQHISVRIFPTESGVKSLYTFKDSYSLLVFEIAQCIYSKATIVKCKNCGHYFVPEHRSDEVYCTYPLRNGSTKSCKEVGAQIARTNKEKNDVATKEYRKIYMRYKMALKRNPDDTGKKKQFEQLTSQAREWRNRMDSDPAAKEEFMEWLKQF